MRNTDSVLWWHQSKAKQRDKKLVHIDLTPKLATFKQSSFYVLLCWQYLQTWTRQSHSFLCASNWNFLRSDSHDLIPHRIWSCNFSNNKQYSEVVSNVHLVEPVKTEWELPLLSSNMYHIFYSSQYHISNANFLPIKCKPDLREFLYKGFHLKQWNDWGHDQWSLIISMAAYREDMFHL